MQIRRKRDGAIGTGPKLTKHDAARDTTAGERVMASFSAGGQGAERRHAPLIESRLPLNQHAYRERLDIRIALAITTNAIRFPSLAQGLVFRV